MLFVTHTYKPRRTLFWGMCVMVSMGLWGCEETATQVAPEHFYPLKEGNVYGYINKEGDKVIPPHYAYAIEFSEGLAGVNVGGKGRGRDMPENGKWGFIDTKNQIVINPKYYSPPIYAAPYDLQGLSMVSHEAYVFSEGLAAVRLLKEWAYINTRDSIVISGLNIQSARRFSEGLAAVYIDGKWGYIDRNGIIAIKPQFLFPANFHQGHAYVMDADWNTYPIDRSGNRMFTQYRIAGKFNNGYAPVKGGFRGEKFEVSENLKMGLLDSTGYLSIPPQFDILRDFGSELAPVLVGSEQSGILTLKDDFKTLKFVGGKWGFVNAKGKFIINPTFEDAKGFSNGLAPVKLNGLWGYIDNKGSLVYEPQFQWAGHFDEWGVAKVLLGEAHRPYQGKHGYINKDKVIGYEP